MSDTHDRNQKNDMRTAAVSNHSHQMAPIAVIVTAITAIHVATLKITAILQIANASDTAAVNRGRPSWLGHCFGDRLQAMAAGRGLARLAVDAWSKFYSSRIRRPFKTEAKSTSKLFLTLHRICYYSALALIVTCMTKFPKNPSRGIYPDSAGSFLHDICRSSQSANFN